MGGVEMTEAPRFYIAEDLTLQPLDPMSNEQVGRIAGMHYQHLVEELDRIGQMAPGFPVATWLTTFFIQWEGESVGFLALDVKRYAVELIYLKPAYRGKHFGTLILATLARSEHNGRRLALKAPLAPAAEAISDRLRLGTRHSDPEQVAGAERELEKLHDSIRRMCTHKRRGDPRKPCLRCYRKVLRTYTTEMVMAHIHDIRLVSRSTP